ncbi:cell wall hydrolase [Novosphingobium sp. 1949]|uniref:Cell wall hydrolase n=1 Tax=Novosphingobium organovorum TaxID=2930092 RepID=A0ABT0BB11_9SPHN|nr:cell wall hydrolase [Novosphingobium organovorum]MCJ2182218.1 cell wall hydrolase [Novosphingobium organovorum]
MATKLEWASAVALAATVVTAVLSAQGSGAAAQDRTPIAAQTEPTRELAGDAAKGPVRFVSNPVVQGEASEPAPEAQDDTSSAQDDAQSLDQLVALQTLPRKLDRQMRCLAGAIYFEARGESLEGQLAVGRVVINRANSGVFPDSYCGVVYQPSQFSFVRHGRMPRIAKASQAWRNAVAIARIAIADGWTNPARGALYFHAARVAPRWNHDRIARVDNHVFYR